MNERHRPRLVALIPSCCLSAAKPCISSTEGHQLVRAIRAQDAMPDDERDSENPRPPLSGLQRPRKGRRHR